MFIKITEFLTTAQGLDQEFLGQPAIIRLAVFVVSRFALVGGSVARFIVRLPLTVAWGPMRSFQTLAPRATDGTYLISYRTHLRERGLSAAAVTLAILFVAIKFFSILALTEFFFPPRNVEAYSGSVTLNPSWDRSSYKHDETIWGDPDCTVNPSAYNCESATATTLMSALTQNDVGCATTDDYLYRSAMRFSLANVPVGATVTSVQLTVNVSTATSATITILRTSVDDISASSCTSATATGMYSRMATGTTYTTASNWNTTGSKTYTLGSTANSDVQSRIGGNITIALTASAATTGQVSSTDAASNKPQLVVAYTLPPQAPTSVSHSANTASSITWSWTDNATADTANYIHDASNTVKCTAGAIASTGSTGTCEETSLSANTQYTRHVNAVDADGNTDSASSASAYTSIETPAGVSFDTIGSTNLTISATGALSNLATASSGLYCQESVTGTNSGWVQTNSWAKSGLSANTQYSYQCKARNGDGDETSLTSAATKYTLIQTPSGVSFSNITTTGMDVAASGTISNLASGSSGLYFQENTGATNSGWTQTNSWSKSSLNPNTQYTFQVKARNGDGTETSLTNAASKYTAIQAPASVTFTSASANSLTLGATGTLSNLSSGSSGVYCQDNTTSVNSGWLQTNSWTESGLTANTQYSYQCKARNGDGTETALSSATSLYTAAASPNVASSRSASTWYTTAGFPFTSSAAFGAGGVQYYRYVWDDSSSYDWTLTQSNPIENTWSDANAKCPSAACTSAGATLTVTAPSAGDTWYLHVRAFNGNDVTSNSQDLGPFWFDGTTPSISHVKSSVSQTALTVTWLTSEPATSQIEYGTTTGYGTLTDLDATQELSHEVLVSNLTPGTTYHYRIRSKDAAGNERVSSDYLITTNAPTAATISSLQAGSIATTSATISWTTSLAATSVVEYGTTASYGSTASASGTATSHSVALSGLTPNAVYHYRVNTTDVNGQTVTSTDGTFTTLALTTITGATVTKNSTTSVTVSWTTNHAADSKVRYGKTTNYGGEVFDATLVTSHSLTITGLEAGTTYHYEILSQGNSTAIDADATFTTDAEPSVQPVAATIPAPTLLGPEDGAIVVDRKPTVVGLATSAATITVSVDGTVDGTTQAKSTNTGVGSFSYEIKAVLRHGSHRLSVTATDAKGITSSASPERSFIIAEPTTPPSVAKTVVSGTDRPVITITGQAQQTGTLKIFVDGEVVKTIRVTKDQKFSYTLSTDGTLAPGDHEVIFQVIDSTNTVKKTTRLVTFTKTKIAKAAPTKPVIRLTPGTKYRVVKGDSLWIIAERFYGLGARFVNIVQANISAYPGLGINPSLIFPGWELKIPRLQQSAHR